MKMEYAWTPERSRSFEVGLRQPPFMKFDNVSGLCGFYQQFVEGFQAVAAPLTAMFKAHFEWEWRAVNQAAFDKLKQAMINATHLAKGTPGRKTRKAGDNGAHRGGGGKKKKAPTPDAPHPGKRRPPRAPSCRPHSTQSQLARARAVGLVTGLQPRAPPQPTASG